LNLTSLESSSSRTIRHVGIVLPINTRLGFESGLEDKISEEQRGERENCNYSRDDASLIAVTPPALPFLLERHPAGRQSGRGASR
jgi:hypothetical protein